MHENSNKFGIRDRVGSGQNLSEHDQIAKPFLGATKGEVGVSGSLYLSGSLKY